MIDLSHRIQDGMPVYPGDAKTSLIHSRQIRRDNYNNHELTINMHAGTHIDGPMHLLDIPKYLYEFPLDTFIGEGCVLDVRGSKTVEYKEEYEHRIQEGQIVILYTGHSRHYGQPDYFNDYPVLTQGFAECLVRRKVKMIGLDTPSPDTYPFDIHSYLFHHHVLIIENLTRVEQLLALNRFEIIALPLNIQADSSIARVIAREIGDGAL